MSPIETVSSCAVFQNYFEQMESNLLCVGSVKEPNFEITEGELEQNVKYFFARDLLNYAKYISFHLCQVGKIEQDNSATWKTVKDGEWNNKINVSLTARFKGQTPEQEIKFLKRYGGTVWQPQGDVA